MLRLADLLMDFERDLDFERDRLPLRQRLTEGKRERLADLLLDLLRNLLCERYFDPLRLLLLLCDRLRL